MVLSARLPMIHLSRSECTNCKSSPPSFCYLPTASFSILRSIFLLLLSPLSRFSSFVQPPHSLRWSVFLLLRSFSLSLLPLLSLRLSRNRRAATSLPSDTSSIQTSIASSVPRWPTTSARSLARLLTHPNQHPQHPLRVACLCGHASLNIRQPPKPIQPLLLP